ncbi:lipid II:glycine glycyltransferase FemX [Patescibacteria group bacterium]
MNLELKIHTSEELSEYINNVADITYSKEFFSLQKKRYNFDNGFIGIYENDKLLAIFPANYSEKEFYSVYKNYCEPIIFESVNWKSVISAIKEKFNVKYTELNFCFEKSILNQMDLTKTALSCFVLKIDKSENRETLFKKFNKKTRNEIRKAEKFGFEMKIGGIEYLEKIYELYKENMKRHGTPAKSKDYFSDLFSWYNRKCRAIMVFDKEILAGVNLILINGNCLRLPFNLSKKEYWNKCVNNLVYYKMIEWGSSEGIRVFDFGPNLDNDKSHSHFKLGFGAEKFPIYKLAVGNKSYFIKKWINQKRYNLKIRMNRIRG